MMKKKTTTNPFRILFLTTEDPDIIGDNVQNWALPGMLKERGAAVEIRSWRESDLDAATLSSFNCITFLWCDKYHLYVTAFLKYVNDVMIPVQNMETGVRIINDPQIIKWNADKVYLMEMKEAGFRIPKTEFVNLSEHTIESLISVLNSLQERPRVIKPSISASGKSTHYLKNPHFLTLEDTAFLELVLSQEEIGLLMIQEYEEDIVNGEYSLVFINGKYTHAKLKTPRVGEFRCQPRYGGTTREMDTADVPQDAQDTSSGISKYLQNRFEGSEDKRSNIKRKLVYLRVDGIVRRNGVFVLMEIEAIEPHLWLETSGAIEALEEYCKTVFGS